ncbi:hypothetical protein [Rathayibacter soli]|uniref:hypothetical protein n=1 Tax=Rathayibacter soli TaxID=3144168 RepID=UPI0027E4BC80|nr:hypothetical protein [Glaciibacter superstes]
MSLDKFQFTLRDETYYAIDDRRRVQDEILRAVQKRGANVIISVASKLADNIWGNVAPREFFVDDDNAPRISDYDG